MVGLVLLSYSWRFKREDTDLGVRQKSSEENLSKFDFMFSECAGGDRGHVQAPGWAAGSSLQNKEEEVCSLSRHAELHLCVTFTVRWREEFHK